jgi:inosose dehydratase
MQVARTLRETALKYNEDSDFRIGRSVRDPRRALTPAARLPAMTPRTASDQPNLRRRQFLAHVRDLGLGLACGLLTQTPLRSEPVEKPGGVSFSFGTYGMKSLRTEDAVRAIAEIGYDGVELAVRPDWDAAPGRMPPKRRRELRAQLSDLGLRVTALMEHLMPSPADDAHAADLQRLQGVAELSRELAPDSPPLIQTVLGGGDWESQRGLFRDRLGDWVNVARQAGVVIAIKPHRGGAMSRPDEAIWLIRQLDDTPWLRMVYDYSHYAFREMPLAETIETALPYTAHVAIKDAVQTDKGVRFELPGASGQFDYAPLFAQFYRGGYRGDFCCEVSGMVWSQPDYDPLVAARACYKNIQGEFVAAMVPRVSKTGGESLRDS